MHNKKRGCEHSPLFLTIIKPELPIYLLVADSAGATTALFDKE